jgi:hypothetical protein
MSFSPLVYTFILENNSNLLYWLKFLNITFQDLLLQKVYYNLVNINQILKMGAPILNIYNQALVIYMDRFPNSWKK